MPSLLGAEALKRRQSQEGWILADFLRWISDGCFGGFLFFFWGGGFFGDSWALGRRFQTL